MQTTRRRAVVIVIVVVVVVALAFGAAACTGASGRSDASPSATGPAEDVIRPGRSDVYRYANAGLEATLDLSEGTLEIDNGTDHDVGKPSFYVLNAFDGSRTDGRVLDPAPIPAGERATFEIELDVPPKDIGLIILVLGDDNYGAFVRT
ncbi:MAG: hypothetical protein KatS3mg014_1846 [Actinomycetota bacterium]|nr:MAG: hypothetical protein KatS3mg014_1846 [Actinomycetota bacterium]